MTTSRITDYEKRAKQSEDKILSLQSSLKSLVQQNHSKYKYEVLYYGLKNRGNFARLCFEEAGIQYSNIHDYKQLMSFMRCNNKISKENASKLPYDLMAPPAVIRTPKNAQNTNNIFCLSQTVAIFQYLSEEFNLRPSTLEDHYLAIALVANCNDILSEIFKHRLDEYDELNAFYTNRIQKWLDILQKPLTRSMNQKYYFNDRCLAVDIAVFNMCDGIIEVMDNRKKELFIETHFILYSHYKRIQNRKSIKKCINEQNKLNWSWWPAQYGFGDCIERLNGRNNKKNDEQKESKAHNPAGSWNKVETSELLEAANFAKREVLMTAATNQEPIKCYDIISGAKQVVAGINYKIKLKIDNNRFVNILVYQSLPPIKYETKSIEFIPKPKIDNVKLSQWKSADKQDIIAAANSCKDVVEMMRIKDNKIKFDEYVPINGIQQKDKKGVNYKIKVKVGKNRWINIIVFRSKSPIRCQVKGVLWTCDTEK